MKKTLKMLMVALLVIPCAVIMVACGSSDKTVTPPNYEAVAKKHTLSTSSTYIKTGTAGYFEYTNKDFDGIIEDYLLNDLGTYYAEELDNVNTDLYFVDDGDDRRALTGVFDEFDADYNFELLPDTESNFTGKINIYANSAAETAIYEDLAFTISETDGAMTITGDTVYENAYIKYTYNNGEITVEINAAQIIKNLINKSNDDYDLGIASGKIAQVPALWVQFELN